MDREVWRTRHMLSAQFQLMIRTDRKTVEDKGDRGKNFGVEIEPYTDKQIADIAAAVAEAAERRRGPARVLGGCRGRRRTRALVKGLLALLTLSWHAGVGMGLYGVKSLDLAISSERIPSSSDPMTSISPTSINGCTGIPSGHVGRRPTTYDYGRMRETWLIHLCTD